MAAMRPETSTIHDLVCVCNLFRYSRNPSCCRHFNFDYKTYSILKISIFHRFKRTSNVNGKKQRKRVVCGADRQPTNAVLLHTQFGKKPNENRNGVQLVWLFESFSSLYITAAYKMLKFSKRKCRLGVEKYENEKCGWISLRCAIICAAWTSTFAKVSFRVFLRISKRHGTTPMEKCWNASTYFI